MLLLVDTSVLIDHLRGDPRAVGRLRAAVEEGEELWSVSVVRTEILAGARPSEEEQIGLEVKNELADAAGRLASTYFRSHPGVDTVDYLLAAASQHIDARLLTQNVRHFPMFPGLEPAY